MSNDSVVLGTITCLWWANKISNNPTASPTEIVLRLHSLQQLIHGLLHRPLGMDAKMAAVALKYRWWSCQSLFG